MSRKDKTMDIIKLAKPYVFEGTEYGEIDLSGLDKLTVQDAIDAQLALTGQPSAVILPERSTAYIARLCAKAAGLPIEFFELLPVSAARKVRGTFTAFMTSDADEDTGMVLKLKVPYTYKGKTYKEVDMSGAAELTVLERACRCGPCGRRTGAGLPVLLPDGGTRQRHGQGVLYRDAPCGSNAHQKRDEQQPFFRVKGGGKGLRKCAVRLAGATMTSIEFYLKLPVRDFIEINNEVAAEWQKLRN